METSLCWKNLLNDCKRGKSCPYTHELQPFHFDPAGEKFGFIYEFIEQVRDFQGSHCVAYFEDCDGCAEGDDCRLVYAHVLTLADFTHAIQEDYKIVKNKKSSKPVNTKICFEQFIKGQCQYGEKCKKSHVLLPNFFARTVPLSDVNAIIEQSDELGNKGNCKNYLSSGKCDNNDKKRCKFEHLLSAEMFSPAVKNDFQKFNKTQIPNGKGKQIARRQDIQKQNGRGNQIERHGQSERRNQTSSHPGNQRMVSLEYVQEIMEKQKKELRREFAQETKISSLENRIYVKEQNEKVYQEIRFSDQVVGIKIRQAEDHMSAKHDISISQIAQHNMLQQQQNTLIANNRSTQKYIANGERKTRENRPKKPSRVYQISSNCEGKIIGTAGSKIKQIQTTTNTSCVIDKLNHRVTITGDDDDITSAYEQILKIDPTAHWIPK